METGREQSPGSSPAGPGREPSAAPDLSPAPAVEALLRRRADGSLTGTSNAAAERALLLRLQRSAGNAGVVRLLRQLAPPGEEPEAATASLLVDDDQADPQPHQMRHGEFLDAVEQSVTAAAERLLDPFWVVAGCPWIAHWVGHYRDRTAADTEAAVRRYAPAAAGATSAAALRGLVVERVTAAIEEWQRTGEMPAEAQGAAPEAALGAGRGLEPAVAARMGRVVNADVSRVQIHDDPKSGRMAERLGARAFAVGRHIAFATNQYAPGTPVGDALLAHELAHVDQQRDPAAGGALDRAALEQDADLAAVGRGRLPARGHPAAAAPRVGGALRSERAALRLGSDADTGGPDPGRRGRHRAGLHRSRCRRRERARRACTGDARAGGRHEPPVAERAVAVVRRIIAEYYSGDAAKVSDVRFDDSIPSELETEAGGGAQATGIIRVRASFVEQMAARRNLDDHSRYVLSVGHEILHINQQRARMGGSDRGHEREFLAGYWTATAPEPAGTGRMSAWGRVVNTIDPALRRYYRMPEDKRREYASQRDELLQLRARERARNPRNIPAEPPGEAAQ